MGHLPIGAGFRLRQGYGGRGGQGEKSASTERSVAERWRAYSMAFIRP
jgi:hypothetical protein